MPGNARKKERLGGVSGGKDKIAHFFMQEEGERERRREGEGEARSKKEALPPCRMGAHQCLGVRIAD